MSIEDFSCPFHSMRMIMLGKKEKMELGFYFILFFPQHVPHMVVFSTYKGLIQAICTHHTLL